MIPVALLVFDGTLNECVITKSCSTQVRCRRGLKYGSKIGGSGRFEIFKNLKKFEIKILKKLEFILRFLVKTKLKKFELTCPTKFGEVKNGVEI
jgi:hypothetical protein